MPHNQGALSRLCRADATRQLLHRHRRRARGDRRGRGRRPRLRRGRDRPTRGRHPRDDQRGGSAGGRAQILHRRTPADQILDEFRKADKWGILRFVPAGRMSDERLRAAWVPDFEPDDDPGAWHPQHALYAPLYSADGELLGNMAVDLPPDRRIPTGPDRELLEMFAVQAGVALSNARERERLTERVRLGPDAQGRGRRRHPAGPVRGAAARPSWRWPSACVRVQAWVRCFPNEGRGVEHMAGTPRPLLPDQDIPELRRDLTLPGASLLPIQLRRRRPLVPGAAREPRDAPGGHGLARRRPRASSSRSRRTMSSSATPCSPSPTPGAARRRVRSTPCARSVACWGRSCARRGCSRPSSGSSRSSASSPATAAS